MDATEAKQARQDAIDKLADLINDVEIAMMTTVDEKTGTLRSRPMQTQNERFDGALWFFTSDASAKADEIEDEHEVNLSYAAPKKSRYVSVSGTARLSHDRQKMEQLWHPALKAWFPDGLETDDLALLRVAVDKAEYWDPSSGKLVQIAGFVKALATGERYEPEGHEKLDL